MDAAIIVLIGMLVPILAASLFYTEDSHKGADSDEPSLISHIASQPHAEADTATGWAHVPTVPITHPAGSSR